MELLQNIYGSMVRLIEQKSELSKSQRLSQTTLAPESSSSISKRPSVHFDVPDPVDTFQEKPEPKSLLSVPIARQHTKHIICESDCQCLCHKRHTYQALSMLERIIGRLFLGYSGPSLRQQQCDLPTCRQADVEPAQLTYFFPRWFLDKAISVTVSKSTGTPSFNIKIRQSCTETNRLFALSRCEGVEGIRQLFASKAASPDDVDHRGGWTPLHFAVDHGCLEVCKLLLDCGADPNWEDNTGTGPVEVAWRNILHLKAPPQLAEVYSVLFPGTEYLQERRFNRIHKLVIGLESGCLETEIIANPSLVNERDLDGWTPLQWAARRGNSEAVSLLLARGADPFLTTENENRGPLHLAAQSNSALCMQQLLHYRLGNKVLDINQKDGYGAHRYASLRSTTALLQPLSSSKLAPIPTRASISARDLCSPLLLRTTWKRQHCFSEQAQTISQRPKPAIESSTSSPTWAKFRC